MREGWIVTITSVNDNGKVDHFSFMEYGSLYDCTRLIHLYQPKKGYARQKFEIERGAALV